MREKDASYKYENGGHILAYEQRKHPRQDFCQPAWLRDRNGGSIGECALADISEGGARIAFVGKRDESEPPTLPKRFVLSLTEDNKVLRFCEQIWTAGHEMGVRFLRPGKEAA